MNRLMIRTKHTIIKQTRKSSRYPEPSVLIEPGCSFMVAAYLKNRNKEKVLVVTDKNIIKLKIMDEFVSYIRDEGIDYIIFNSINENLTVDNIMDGVEVYNKNNCDSIIGFGGRSAMDGAKLIGARVSNRKDVYEMKGKSKLRKKLPTFVAVPTLAGTGSEADYKAIVTDMSKFEKITIVDKKLLPEISYLDSKLMVDLPRKILSYSGMNLLAKSIESYLSGFTTKKTEKICVESIKLVFENLEFLCGNRSNAEAGCNLFKASSFSGRADMLALTGYGNLISYILSDAYGISHSYVLSIIFPNILEMSKDKIFKKLSKLALAVNLGSEEEEKAVLCDKFIAKIMKMNNNMAIPEYVEELRERDILTISGIIEKSSNPSVPAPKILRSKDFEIFLYSVLKDKNKC